jgi:hypothetical protein
MNKKLKLETVKSVKEANRTLSFGACEDTMAGTCAWKFKHEQEA